MAGLAVDGLISGMDTSKIISDLMNVEKIPVTLLQNRKTETISKLTTWQNLNARLLALKIQAEKLTKQSNLVTRQATSAKTDLLTVSAGSDAVNSNYTVEVKKLAQSHKISSNALSNPYEARNLNGDILINNKVINITYSDNLQNIVSKINSSGAGVKASLVNVNSTSSKLVLTSNTTGATQIELKDANTANILQTLGFSDTESENKHISGKNADSDSFSSGTQAIKSLLGLNASLSGNSLTIEDGANTVTINVNLESDSLQSIVDKINNEASPTISATLENSDGSYSIRVTSTEEDPTFSFGDSNNVFETLGFIKQAIPDGNELQVAQDAQLAVDGITISRSSNTISDVVSGLTFNLVSAKEGEQFQVSVTDSHNNVQTIMQNFITNYNDVITYINEQTKYNQETGVKGDFLGDSTILGIQRKLFSMVNSAVPKMPAAQLSELNGGNGVSLGSITITNRSGQQQTVNLSEAKTVQDIINTINSEASGINISAKVSSGGKSLELIDASGGNGLLSVKEYESGSTAKDLGLLTQTASNTLKGGNIYNGGSYLLSSLGIRPDKTGYLSFDPSKLEEELNNNPDSVLAFFTTPTYGMAVSANNSLKFLTDAFNGTLTTKQNALQGSINDLDKRIETLNKRLEFTEKKYRNDFSQLEITLSQLQSQGDWLSGQLSSLSAGWAFNKK